jgi:putative tryptophan/tyrosine transport system substrate-binding protein
VKRREFIAGLGAAAWPVATRAQRAEMPTIVYLDVGSPSGRTADNIAAIRRGLLDFGFVEGQNVVIEYRWAENRPEQLPGMVANLVRRQVAVIMAISTQAVLAAKVATTTVPIVFLVGADPIKFGIVTSMNRPGANVTGISTLTNSLEAKKLEVLSQLLPKNSLVAMLINPLNPNAEPDTKDAEAAARQLGLRLTAFQARYESEIETAYTALSSQGAAAVLVASDTLFNNAEDQLAGLALQYRLPAIYSPLRTARIGGLMSYGGNTDDTYRVVGAYAGRILKGEKPENLPVQQATTIEFVINLKTAKALGLTVPETMLAAANEVIE